MLRLAAFTVVLASVAALPVPANASDGELLRARALTQDAIIVDTHIDAPYLLASKWADLGSANPDREFDYPRARFGGLDVAFMSIYTSAQQGAAGQAWQAAHAQIDSVEALVQRHPDKFAILTSPKDVERLRAGGRVLLSLGMENASPLGEDLAQVQAFFDRGVRYITLAHSAANALSDSSYGVERTWRGLSPFGRQAVTEMNRLGIMVDVSHISDAAAAQAIELSKVPVIASHSAFRHFTPGFERNISDALAKAVAAKGGVVQIPFGSAFLNPKAAADIQARFRARAEFDRRNEMLVASGEPPKSAQEFEEAWDRDHPVPSTALELLLDQIDYGVTLIGIDHIGIGSDFDGVAANLVDGLRSVADYPNLVAGLQARDYRDEDIRKILGGNLLRVWREVEAGAGREQEVSLSR